MRRVGKQSIEFNNCYVRTTSTVSGKLEKEGPLGNYFDKTYNDNYCDEKSWEKAEMKLMSDSIDIALKKSILKNILKSLQVFVIILNIMLTSPGLFLDAKWCF